MPVEPHLPSEAEPTGLMEADAVPAEPTGLMEADGVPDVADGVPDVAGFAAAPTAPTSKWIGAENVEVQGCDPESCDLMCGNCEWEACQVIADNLCGQCTVKFEDGQVTEGIQYRHMRIGKRSRRRCPGGK